MIIRKLDAANNVFPTFYVRIIGFSTQVVSYYGNTYKCAIAKDVIVYAELTKVISRCLADNAKCVEMIKMYELTWIVYFLAESLLVSFGHILLELIVGPVVSIPS